MILEQQKLIGILNEIIQNLWQIIDQQTVQLEQEIAEQQQLTHLLLEREARLNDILNSAISTSIVSFRVFPNQDWECEYQSRGSEVIFGYTPQEIITDKTLWMSRVHPQDLENVILPLFTDIFAGRTVAVEYRFHHQDDSWRWISATYNSRYDEVGNCWIVTGTNNDISQHKCVEAALQASEERWQLAIAGTNEAIWDWNILTNETFRSAHWFKMLGYEPDELSDSDDEWSSRIHPDDYDRVIAAQDAYLLKQTAEYCVEYRLRCKDDNYKWFQSRAKAIWNEQGNPIRLVGSIGDISDRQQAQEQLRRSEAQLAATQQIAHVGSWELNLETHRRQWSRETFRIFGLNPTESAPTQAEFLQLIHPEDRSYVHSHIQQTIALKTPFILEYRIIRPDGSVRYLESKAEVAENTQGQQVKLLGAIIDITERKQAELEVIRSRDLLEAIYNESADAIFLVDRETHLTTDCNQRAVEMFGASGKAELINIEGQTLQKQQFTPSETLAIVEEINQWGVWSQEIEYVTKQGNSFWGNLAVKQITVAGTVINLVRITDITARIQTKAALAKSEEQFRLTLELTHIGNWDWDVQSNEVIWNDNHFRLLGLEPDISAAKYQLWHNAIHPEDVNRVEQALLTALKYGRNYETEYRVIYPDGSIHWLTGRGHGIYNDAGEPVRMLGVIIDISDRKKAEQALQEKETFLSSIYDGVGESIFVVDVKDDDFRFVGLNPAHEQLTGLFSQDIQGKTPEEILPPPVAAFVRQNYQDCVDARETITYEECLPFKGQETWWITSLTPLQNENSEIYRIVGNSLNITEHKRAQQMLELQAIITRSMAEGICLVRAADGIIVYANPKFKQMFGYNAGELIGEHISIINYADEQVDAKAVNVAITNAVIQNGEATYEVHNIKKDGTPFWCSATTSVFQHPEYGTVLVAVQQDITEHKQAEEKIKASLIEKEVLLKEIHHRVKNNLGIVSSLLQMQSRRTEDPQATAILRDSQNRIASIALVHEKLYRSEDLANIDFAQYIADLTTYLFDSYNVNSNDIRLQTQVEDLSLDIETAIPCGLIINELVSNALKYAFSSNCEGEIKIFFCQDTNHTCVLIIRDNGVGLPEGFETSKTKTLGLSLVQGLVKQLRGQLEINCQQGTEFKITFKKI
jgi:PAS domain S-box-containing protein